MVQYHAMGLLYYLRKRDRLAVSKMVMKQVRSSLWSPHGYCPLIRIACEVLEDEERGSSGMLYDFLETCLHRKSEVRQPGESEDGAVVKCFCVWYVCVCRWWCMKLLEPWSI